VIAFECPKGNMHINADVLWVEFLRDGRPVGPGESGDIVVTDLFNEVMPVIRYRTGDVGKAKGGDCPCGRALPLMELRVGRQLEMLRLPNGQMVHPQILSPPHRHALFRLVERFRVVQEDTARLRILVVTPREQFSEVQLGFDELVRQQLGSDIDVRVEWVQEIPRNPSGKLPYFVSEIPAVSSGSDS